VITIWPGVNSGVGGLRNLVVANGGDNSVSTLSGNGVGDFFPSAVQPVGIRPSSVVDAYGPVPVALAVANEGSDDVSIGADTKAVGDGPTSIAFFFLGLNSEPVRPAGLAVANGGSDDVSILLNNVPAPQAGSRDSVTLEECIERAKK